MKMSEKQMRKLLLIGIGVIAALLVITVVITTLLKGIGSAQTPSDSQKDNADVVLITGVIYTMNDDLENVGVYSADDQTVRQFDLEGLRLTDRHGNELEYKSLQIGQIVDVRFDKTDEKEIAPRAFGLSEKASELTNVTDAYIFEKLSKLTIGEAEGEFYYDDHVICTYNGDAANLRDLTEQYVFNMNYVGNHIYTINVTQAVGEVEIVGAEQYPDTKLTIKPKYGPKQEIMITDAKPAPIRLTEGFSAYSVESKDGKKLILSGTFFVEAGHKQELILTAKNEEKGLLVVQLLPPGTEADFIIKNKETGEEADVEQPLDYGIYVLTVRDPDFEETTQELRLSQPYFEAQVTPKRTKTALIVRTTVDAAIYVDGEYVGDADAYTPISASVSLAKHTVAANPYNGDEQRISVDLTHKNVPSVVVVFSDLQPTEPETSAPEESGQNSDDSQEAVG